MIRENRQKLAIDGGAKTRQAPMPPRHALGPAERLKIQAVLDHYDALQRDPGYQGHFEALYTDAFVEFMGGRGYADAVATGTSAVYLALASLDLPRGAQVLVSPITDPGTLSAIILQGLVPRLVDTAPGSYNTSAAEIAKRLTPEVKAICLVHAAGEPADIEAVTGLAANRGIPLVEDCSQAHGAMAAGRRLGTFGAIAAFSTMYRKAHMTGASGGLFYTADEERFRRAMAHADRGKPRWQDGFDDKDPGTFLFPALNHHTDEISCGVGIASLGRLDETRQRRMAFVEGLRERLPRRSRVCRTYALNADSSPFYLPIHVELERLTVTKKAFALAVAAEGVDINADYRYVVADWPWVKPHLADGFDCPNAHRVRDTTFNILFNENYGPTEAEDIAMAIEKVESFYVS